MLLCIYNILFIRILREQFFFSCLSSSDSFCFVISVLQCFYTTLSKSGFNFAKCAYINHQTKQQRQFNRPPTER